MVLEEEVDDELDEELDEELEDEELDEESDELSEPWLEESEEMVDSPVEEPGKAKIVQEVRATSPMPPKTNKTDFFMRHSLSKREKIASKDCCPKVKLRFNWQ